MQDAIRRLDLDTASTAISQKQYSIKFDAFKEKIDRGQMSMENLIKHYIFSRQTVKNEIKEYVSKYYPEAGRTLENELSKIREQKKIARADLARLLVEDHILPISITDRYDDAPRDITDPHIQGHIKRGLFMLLVSGDFAIEHPDAHKIFNDLWRCATGRSVSESIAIADNPEEKIEIRKPVSAVVGSKFHRRTGSGEYLFNDVAKIQKMDHWALMHATDEVLLKYHDSLNINRQSKLVSLAPEKCTVESIVLAFEDGTKLKNIPAHVELDQVVDVSIEKRAYKLLQRMLEEFFAKNKHDFTVPGIDKILHNSNSALVLIRTWVKVKPQYATYAIVMAAENGHEHIADALCLEFGSELVTKFAEILPSRYKKTLRYFGLLSKND